MAKFGKKFRQRKIKEWEQHYVDYKKLKHFIKENKSTGKTLLLNFIIFFPTTQNFLLLFLFNNR